MVDAIAVGAAIIGIVLVLLILPPLFKAWNTRRSPEHEGELEFKTDAGDLAKFPHVSEPASKILTVVVPAYNEEKRIGRMLDDMIETLQQLSVRDRKFTWEIVVVDDGSRKDDTAGYVQSNYVLKYGSDLVRLCKLQRNVGKGGAVRKGALRSRGELILMADADGATEATEVASLLKRIKAVAVDGMGIAVGSRAHLEGCEEDAGPKAKRSPFRRFLMWGFKTLLSLLVGGLGVQDTQCGFKMFTRRAAAAIFPAQHIERWAFDVELLYLGMYLGIPIVEVPVRWQEVDGSKVDIVADSLQIARDVAAIRLAYLFGLWRSDDYGQPGWSSGVRLTAARVRPPGTRKPSPSPGRKKLA